MSRSKRDDDTRGEWAGIYVMDAILSLSMEYTDPDIITACASYHYQSVSQAWRAFGDYAHGTDRRYFILHCLFRRWVVRDMGGYQSC